MKLVKLKVSIPYEREGTFRLVSIFVLNSLPSHGGFQFPTNGKAHSDLARYFILKEIQATYVSIPYEREGTFRRNDTRRRDGCLYCVSIPYEREGTFRQRDKKLSNVLTI